MRCDLIAPLIHTTSGSSACFSSGGPQISELGRLDSAHTTADRTLSKGWIYRSFTHLYLKTARGEELGQTNRRRDRRMYELRAGAPPKNQPNVKQVYFKALILFFKGLNCH